MKRNFLLLLVLLLPYAAFAAKQPATHSVAVYSDNLKQQAQNGDAEAQYVLGRVLLYGYGTDVDEPQAFSWFEKSANQGSPLGKFGMAECYEKGWGVNNDGSTIAFPVTQAAKATHLTLPEGNKVEFPKEGGTKEVVVDTDGAVEIRNNMQGLQAEYKNGKLILKADKNDGNYINDKVTLIAGDYLAVLNVTIAGNVCPT